ncbi:hypothetical protein ONZ45_g17618 [Pleurotus djamor]|nr:hypothetical protein ONZ45_g17618 [Pleurotus djamor]
MMSISHQDTIDHVNLSLSCLAHLIQYDGPKEDTLMPTLLEEQEQIFSWISLLLPLQTDSLDSTRWARGLSLLSILSSVFRYLSDHLGAETLINVHTSNAIAEVWHRLQAPSIVGWELLNLVEAINTLVGHSLRLALGKTPNGEFVEKFGGVSRIPVLLAASLAQYLQNLSPNPLSEYDRLLLVLVSQNTSTLISLFCDKLLPYSILSGDTVHQINISMKYLFKYYPQLDPSLMGPKFEGTRASYFGFIFRCPTTSSYYPIVDMLQLGIVNYFRTIETRTIVIEQFGQLLGFYVKFPAIVPFMERFVSLPSHPRAIAAWASTDASMWPYIRAWNESRADAKQYAGCTICQRTDWNFGHRWICEIFRLCGTDNPLIRTNNPSCLFYLSKLEVGRGLRRSADKYASTAGQFPVPAAEIPLLSDSFDQQRDGADIKFKRFQDFPDLFDNEKIRQVVVPRIKDFIRMKMIPEYLTVLSININREGIHILSPTIGLIIGDLPTIKQRVAQSQTQ